MQYKTLICSCKLFSKLYQKMLIMQLLYAIFQVILGAIRRVQVVEIRWHIPCNHSIMFTDIIIPCHVSLNYLKLFKSERPCGATDSVGGGNHTAVMPHRDKSAAFGARSWYHFFLQLSQLKP